jgi:hypothetical protein
MFIIQEKDPAMLDRNSIIEKRKEEKEKDKVVVLDFF